MAERPDTSAQTNGAEKRSVGELARDVMTDVQNIIQAEIRLARTEFREN